MNRSTDTATPEMITSRLDRLPMTPYMWKMLALISFGAFFEQYDMYFTGYIAPSLFHDKIFTPTTVSFFGMTGLAGFLASLFAGLFVGTIVFSHIADRFGRRTIFTYALLWYSAATLILAFQNTPGELNFWRFVGGIGVGVELVTIDAYISELIPKASRGKAFGMQLGLAQICAPVIALMAWILIPISPMGVSGWRWIVAVGSVGALVVWWLRLRLPESPRWLAQQGRLAEAESVIVKLETKVQSECKNPLPEPERLALEDERPGRYLEIFSPAYRSRTIMLMVVNLFQTIGFYGFVSWIPTLLIAKGIHITQGLAYTFFIVLMFPVAPLLVMLVADRFERKWQLMISASAVAVVGIIFANMQMPIWLILVGCLQTLVVNWMSTLIHTYQSELFPTRIRARAVGFVYSWSRFSSIFTGFIIAFLLRDFGVPAVFLFIGSAMAIVVIAIGMFGPRTTGLALETIASTKAGNPDSTLAEGHATPAGRRGL